MPSRGTPTSQGPPDQMHTVAPFSQGSTRPDVSSSPTSQGPPDQMHSLAPLLRGPTDQMYPVAPFLGGSPSLSHPTQIIITPKIQMCNTFPSQDTGLHSMCLLQCSTTSFHAWGNGLSRRAGIQSYILMMLSWPLHVILHILQEQAIIPQSSNLFMSRFWSCYHWLLHLAFPGN